MTNETPWVQRLADDIFRSLRVKVAPKFLLQQISEFVDDCPDKILKSSYPVDRRRWEVGRELPQYASRDLVLSFLDARYPGANTEFTQEAVRTFDRAASTSNSNVDVSIAKEIVRRGPPEKAKSYWFKNLRRVLEKYTGTYCLIRRSAGDEIRFELFFLNSPEPKKIVLPFAWQCDSKLRIGDLITNTERFSGTAVCKSTDSIIEPVAMQFLRAGRGDRGRDPVKLILGGVLSGWKDADRGKMVTTRLCLIKMNTSLEHGCDIERVKEHFSSAEVQDKLRAFEKFFSDESDGLLNKFVKCEDSILGLHDARDAAGSMPNSLFQ